MLQRGVETWQYQNLYANFIKQLFLLRFHISWQTTLQQLHKATLHLRVWHKGVFKGVWIYLHIFAILYRHFIVASMDNYYYYCKWAKNADLSTFAASVALLPV